MKSNTAKMLLLLACACLVVFTASIYSKAQDNKRKRLSNEDKVVATGTKDNTRQELTVIKYTVAKDDTVESIAKRFKISNETVVWANDIRDNKIQEGDVLDILPITGVIHTVKENESLLEIAKMYEKISDEETSKEIINARLKEIAVANILDIKSSEDIIEYRIVPGQKIIIPGGVKS
jgi:hypothetical protein